MDFQTALLSAVGGLVTTTVFLASGIIYLYKRDVKRSLSSETKVDNIRKAMELRMVEGEARCHSELTAARVDISRLNTEVSALAQRDRDVAIAAIMFYADKRDADRDLMEEIARKLDVEIPMADPQHRTTVTLKAITGARR